MLHKWPQSLKINIKYLSCEGEVQDYVLASSYMKMNATFIHESV